MKRYVSKTIKKLAFIFPLLLPSVIYCNKSKMVYHKRFWRKKSAEKFYNKTVLEYYYCQYNSWTPDLVRRYCNFMVGLSRR